MVDGTNIPELPLTAWRDRKFKQNSEILMGTNSNEANLFVWPFQHKPMSAAQYANFVHEVVNGHDAATSLNASQIAQVFDQYKPSTTQDNRPMASALLTDLTFLCGTRFAGSVHHSSYVYRFDHRSQCLDFLKPLVPGGCPRPSHLIICVLILRGVQYFTDSKFLMFSSTQFLCASGRPTNKHYRT